MNLVSINSNSANMNRLGRHHQKNQSFKNLSSQKVSDFQKKGFLQNLPGVNQGYQNSLFQSQNALFNNMGGSNQIPNPSHNYQRNGNGVMGFGQNFKLENVKQNSILEENISNTKPQAALCSRLQ